MSLAHFTFPLGALIHHEGHHRDNPSGVSALAGWKPVMDRACCVGVEEKSEDPSNPGL